MENGIKPTDYIKPDIREDRAKGKSKDTLQMMMEDNRGILSTTQDEGSVSISSRIFAEYVLRRIDLFRIDSNERYIKNQVTHGFEKVSDIVLKSICMEIMDEYNSSYYEFVKENTVLGFIDKQAETYRNLKTDDRYILFPNGIYDLEEFSFDDQFQTNPILTYQMGFEYNPDADSPEWMNALSKMFPDDQEAVFNVIQEIFGYTFAYGSAQADKLFYLYGKGRNGKSILSFVLRKLHGEENIAGTPLAELGERFSLSTIWDKRVCICPENPYEKLLDTSTLKALTGRDAVKVEAKYGHAFTAVLITKIIVNSNHYLRTDDDSVGFWERILPIPFDVTFLQKSEYKKKTKSVYFRLRDTRLEEKLEKELPGIFNWAMEGLRRLRNNKWAFTESSKVIGLKNQMMRYCKPISAYVSECVIQGNADGQNGKTDRVKSSVVYQRFLKWADEKTLGVADYDARRFRKAFKESLKEQGIEVDVVKNSVEYYVGIIVRQ